MGNILLLKVLMRIVYSINMQRASFMQDYTIHKVKIIAIICIKSYLFENA